MPTYSLSPWQSNKYSHQPSLIVVFVGVVLLAGGYGGYVTGNHLPLTTTTNPYIRYPVFARLIWRSHGDECEMTNNYRRISIDPDQEITHGVG